MTNIVLCLEGIGEKKSRAKGNRKAEIKKADCPAPGKACNLLYSDLFLTSSFVGFLFLFLGVGGGGGLKGDLNVYVHSSQPQVQVQIIS